MKENTRRKAEALLNHLKAEDLNHVESFKTWLDSQTVTRTVVQPTVQATSRWVNTSNEFTPQEVKKKVVAAGKRVVRTKDIEEAVIIEKSEPIKVEPVVVQETEVLKHEGANESLIVAASKETVEEKTDTTEVTDEELMITYGGVEGIIKFLKEKKVPRVGKNWTQEKAIKVLRGYMENA